MLVDCTLPGAKDFEVEPTAREPMKLYGVNGWPTAVFLDPKGRVLDRFSSCRQPKFVLDKFRKVRAAAATLARLEKTLEEAKKIDGLPVDSVLSKLRAAMTAALAEKR